MMHDFIPSVIHPMFTVSPDVTLSGTALYEIIRGMTQRQLVVQLPEELPEKFPPELSAELAGEADSHDPP